MKRLYKIVIFFAVFHLVVLLVSSLGIFPNTLYSDAEIDELTENLGEHPEAVFSYLFAPDESIFGYSTITVNVIILAFTVIGIGTAILTKNWYPAIITIIGLSFLPMLLRSRSFFDKLFTSWDSTSLMYISLIFGVVLILIVVMTIMEIPAHGDA